MSTRRSRTRAIAATRRSGSWDIRSTLCGASGPTSACSGVPRATTLARTCRSRGSDHMSDNRGFARDVQSEVYRAGLSGTRPAVPVDGAALERAARKALSAEGFAYLAGGAGAEATMAANRAAFARWAIWPRVLRDVAERDLSIELL